LAAYNLLSGRTPVAIAAAVGHSQLSTRLSAYGPVFYQCRVRIVAQGKAKGMGSIKWTVFAYIAGAALSWGVYVPLVHKATASLGSNLRAFLMVGVAYFLVAVLVPAFFIFVLKNDPTVKNAAKLNWASASLTVGLLAGAAGAIGALFVIFATRDAVAAVGPVVGPLIVAPAVFAGAPIVNTIASMTIFAHGRKFEAPGAGFYLGLVLAAAGMVMVMVNKPKGQAPAESAPAVQQTPSATDA
jgi:hypothetical protein